MSQSGKWLGARGLPSWYTVDNGGIQRTARGLRGVSEERLEGHDLVVEQLLELLLVELLVVELEVLWVERGHRRLVLWVVLQGGAQVSRKAG